VAPPPMSERLLDLRPVTLILRLLVDRRGRLVQGEVVDVEARPRGRFVGWRGLVRTARAALER
jgi:hypothetical protein